MEDIKIKLSGTEYVMSGRTFELYTQGCDVQCPGCHNKETWDWNAGYYISASELQEKFETFDIMIKRFWILGGEPMQQDLMELIKLLRFLKQFDKEVWLFTSYDMYQIYPGVRDLCDYIKTGIHDPSMGKGEKMYGVQLATKNQKIWKRGVDF